MNMISFSDFMVLYSPLIQKITAQYRYDIDEVQNEAYLLIVLGGENGKGTGWLINALRGTCRKNGLTDAVLSLDDFCSDAGEFRIACPFALPPETALLSAEEESVRQKHLDSFGDDGTFVVRALCDGSLGLAKRLNVTRRRAQQLIDRLVISVECALSNDEVLAAIARMALRIREADLIRRSAQQDLFWGEA